MDYIDQCFTNRVLRPTGVPRDEIRSASKEQDYILKYKLKFIIKLIYNCQIHVEKALNMANQNYYDVVC